MNKEQLARLLTRDRMLDYSNLLGVSGPKEKFHFANQADGTDFFLYNAIGGYEGITSTQVAEAIASVQGDLNLHFNSIGGSIFEGSAIFNIFNNYKRGTVTSYIDGVAASAASFISMAASPYNPSTGKGGVQVERNATMMIHDAMGGVIGTPTAMREQADVLDKLGDIIADTYARKAGGTGKSWRKVMQTGDKWYNAQEAVKAKLADVVAGDTTPANSIDVGLFSALLDPDDAPSPQGPTPTNPVPTNPENDFEGFRNALKGAFA